MTENIKVKKLLNKHRSSIIFTIKSNTFKYTDAKLFDKLEKLMQEVYNLGHDDGWAEAFAVMNGLEE